ncbi:MAG: 2-amino-4-hydroxy-6-hydroxymethyldihydropteridine diphosphokinase [Alphaproteobacteria bacterium GM7ARS4]|nr:2-amino-4-hydroxy-6-hydroxymethyldihydropteridine diphosphokinase [Alphaproteobacteria bacterium GM7ARS4]
MIIIGLGSNQEGREGCSYLENCRSALSRFSSYHVRVVAVSRWYRSKPMPVSDQPWFINGVAQIETSLSPVHLLRCAHAIEHDMGRKRMRRNEARPIDIDILDYGGRICTEQQDGITLPHPRMHGRGFVLYPLLDIAPAWVHPVLHKTARSLLDTLSDEQEGMFIE